MEEKSFSVPEYDVNVFFEKRNKYCLLIPLFNEGERYFSQVKKMKKNEVFNKVDVIVCDAGSIDGTTESHFLRETGHRAVLTRHGYGRQSTDIRMGLYWAMQQDYEGFITVDGNDKDDTSRIDLFIGQLDKGYDYIQGSRYIKGGKGIRTPLIRHLALKLINEPIMSLCAHKHLTNTTNGFRGFSRRFLMDDRVQPFRNIFVGYELCYYLPVRACRLGYRICEVPVIREYPKSGEIPSKIGGLRGNIYQLSILYHIIMKHYNPESNYKFK